MTEHVDMSAFIVAKSDQLNADDLMDSPKTITITKVTASPDATEQPVSLHYEGGEGRPFKPCKTVRRILVSVWGKDASKYVGRSMTLYRDGKVQFGGLQVGGIRVSHMSHIDGEKTVALLVTKGRKAPFTIKPLVNAPAQSTPANFDAQLAELKAIATPGNMDALGAKWQEIGADARKALAAELPALKAACAKADDVPFDGGPTLGDQLGLDDAPAGSAKVQEIKAALAAAKDADAVEAAVAEYEKHKAALDEDMRNSVEIAISQARAKAKAGEGVE